MALAKLAMLSLNRPIARLQFSHSKPRMFLPLWSTARSFPVSVSKHIAQTPFCSASRALYSSRLIPKRHLSLLSRSQSRHWLRSCPRVLQNSASGFGFLQREQYLCPAKTV